MNGNQANINQPTAPMPPAPTGPSVTDKIRLKVKELALNFYSNKKVFWPITIATGLILFTLIIGLVFGSKSRVGQVKTTPTPQTSATPEATESADILTETQNKLNDLKREIQSFDVKQSQLQPPTLNFKISF